MSAGFADLYAEMFGKLLEIPQDFIRLLLPAHEKKRFLIVPDVILHTKQFFARDIFL